MKRIIYTVREYEPLIDSCDVTPVHWKQIAQDIYVSAYRLLIPLLTDAAYDLSFRTSRNFPLAQGSKKVKR